VRELLRTGFGSCALLAVQRPGRNLIGVTLWFGCSLLGEPACTLGRFGVAPPQVGEAFVVLGQLRPRLGARQEAEQRGALGAGQLCDGRSAFAIGPACNQRRLGGAVQLALFVGQVPLGCIGFSSHVYSSVVGVAGWGPWRGQSRVAHASTPELHNRVRPQPGHLP
jgi:hypothetical protein